MAEKKKNMKKNMKGGENRKERADHLLAEEKAEVKEVSEEKAPLREVKSAPEEKAPVPETKGTPEGKAPVPEEKEKAAGEGAAQQVKKDEGGKIRPGAEISEKIREARERRREEVLQRRMEMRDEAEQRRVKFQESAKEMSEDLRQMLAKEIEEMNHREKTRGVEILGIFARHNFYAGGFTPLELRTTLEDLGPTFVKIGQIMSSRVDLLPESYCRELERLRQDGVTESELTRVREQTKSNIVIGLESSAARMNRLGYGELFLGRSMDAGALLAQYDAVTCEDVLASARRLLDPKSLSFSAVGRLSPREDYLKILQSHSESALPRH